MKGWSRVLLAALMLCLLASMACAEEALNMRAQIGYDGLLLSGEYVPLQVWIENPADQEVDGEISVDIGMGYEKYDRIILPVTVGAGEQVQVTLDVRPQIVQRTFDVMFEANGERLAFCSVDAQEVTSSSAIHVGVLSSSDALLQAWTVTHANDALSREEIFTPVWLNAENFPANDEQMSAFDLLVVDDFDVSTFSNAQWTAMERFIKAGGIVMLGAGEDGASSLAAFEALTGVHAGDIQLVPMLGLLRSYVSMAGGEDPAQTEAVALTGGQAMIAYQDEVLMASAEVGKGLVITCGFSLSDSVLHNAAKADALWRRVLLETDKTRYNALFSWKSRSNQRYNSSLSSSLRVGMGESILPIAWMLAAYVLIAGLGLYAFLKRRDSSTRLWAAVPLCSVAAAALVAVMGTMIGAAKPIQSGVMIVQYDEDDVVDSQELVQVSYPQQERMRIQGMQGERVERTEYFNFESWSPMDTSQMSLRDAITIGDAPALELAGGATWLTRDLVIDSGYAPQGAVQATAFLDQDGLHAHIDNATDVNLQGAVLITPLGYAHVGDLPAGQGADVFMPRTQTVQLNPDGEMRIAPQEAMLYPVNRYDVVSACVYPEQEMDDSFETDSLPEGEREARGILQSIYSISRMSGSNSAFSLIAQASGIPSTQLTLNGEPITRTNVVRVVIKDIALEPVSPSGYVYLDQTHFSAYDIVEEDGIPQRAQSDPLTFFSSYQGVSTVCMDLSAAKNVEIEAVRIVTSYYSSVEGLSVEAFDYEAKEYVPLQRDGRYVTIDGEMATRVISGAGSLVLRYTDEYNTFQNSYDIPSVVVEGWVRE